MAEMYALEAFTRSAGEPATPVKMFFARVKLAVEKETTFATEVN
jgi:hypothetical protein